MRRVFGFFNEAVDTRGNGDILTARNPMTFNKFSETTLVELSLEEFNILDSLFKELGRADAKYIDDPMVEPKVSVKTIECELTELQREVERSVIRPEAMRKEAVQVMTMGYKFIRDICDKRGEA